MKTAWFINEIVLKLPLVDIKIRTPTPKSGETSISARAKAALEGAHGVKVALKSFYGAFVTAELNTDGELIANRPDVGDWEIFELLRLPDGKIAFRACNGNFVGVKLNEHCQLVADRSDIQGWEAFTLHPMSEGKFAIQAFNRLFVSADFTRNGELVANCPKAQGWEAFGLLLVG